MSILEITDRYPNARQVRKITNPSVDEFQQIWAPMGIPLVITDVISGWEAYSKWNFNYVVEKLGSSDVIVSKQGVNKVSHSSYTLKQLVHIIINENWDEPLYSNFSNHLNTDMVHDYVAPDYFKCWYKSIPKEDQSLVLSWIYLGTQNSFSGLHVDIHNTGAWNALFMGKKLWFFFPSDQIDLLHGGKVNPFQPNLDLYPNLVHASPLICVQEVGEMVYTPSGWWHCVLNLEKGFALTENFINELNFDDVMKDLLSVGATKAIAKLKGIRQSFSVRKQSV